VTLRNVLVGGGVLLALVVVLCLAVIVGIFIGRGSQEEIAKQEEPTKEEQKPEPTEKTQEKKTEVKKTAPSKEIGASGAVLDVGESAALQDGSTVIFNDIQRGYVFPNNSPRPRPGNEFVLMNVTVTNRSAYPIRINPVYFKAEDANGVQRNAQTPLKLENGISTDTIAPYGELTGLLYAEIPQDDPVVKVVYQPAGH
jgi:uncharacterized protein DUF4352